MDHEGFTEHINEFDFRLYDTGSLLISLMLELFSCDICAYDANL